MKRQYGSLGFTLTELLAAVVLMSTVAVVVLSSFSSITKIVRPQNNVAVNIARGHLERFYEYVREDAAYYYNAGTPISYNAPGPQPLTQTLDGVVYTTTYVVNNGSSTAIDVNGDGQEDYRKVKLTVSWPS